MTLATVNDLRNEIAAHIDESVTPQIDTFIRLAESRHRRDIRMREQLVRGALTIDARNVALPDQFIEAVELRLLTDPAANLQDVAFDEMTRVRREAPGQPKYFCIGPDIEFDAAPDQSYSGQITYYQAFTALSDSTQTNVLLTTYPDAYLYAALAASAPFQMADERLAQFDAMYRQIVQGINVSAARSRRAGPMTARVHGSTP